MAGKGVTTNAAVMARTAQEIDGAADRLTSMFSKLMHELTPLQSAWVGAAGSSFQGVKDRFDADVAGLNIALRSIAQAVSTAGRDYTLSDDEMRAEMQQAGAGAGEITRALMIN
ncbi:WXG100 family type VII secretion target [Dactylosporangium sp. CS-033363]|uniref:WXG100 family type VII secretion target n=1 Tax=Dactylosporangium sp. CS-033363 TaxID=3239935 RepID=UPI003D93EDB9